MIFLKVRKQKKKIRCKTQANEQAQQKLRVSISDGVKQRLIQISSINNHLTESRDWTLDEDYQTINLQPFQKRYQEKTLRKDKNVDKNKSSAGKNIKFQEMKLKEDRLRKINKTECSMRPKGSQYSKKECSSITLQFQNSMKQKELRIHSNGQVNIDFENSNFNISEKVFKETANKYQNKSNNKSLIMPYYCKRINELKNSKRTPIIPYKKIACKTIYSNQKAQQISIHRIRENNLSRRKQFLDLSSMLLEEKRNIFYPIKASLSTKMAKGL